MTLLQTLVERHPGIVFCCALILGLIVPIPWEGITSLLVPLMIFMLFLSFLGVDMSHVEAEIRKPVHLILQIILQYILLPVAFFFVLRTAGLPTFAIAAFLIVCMPSGLGSPVLTGLANGRVATSVVFIVVTHIILPVSMPLLFWIFANVNLTVSPLAMAQKLAILICVPLAFAWLARTFTPRPVAATKHYRKLLSILTLSGVAYVGIVPYANIILQDVWSLIPLLLGTYLLFGAICVCSFLLSWTYKPQERIAVIVSRTYMNFGLCIVIAVQFFSKDVALIAILSEIPWFTTFGLYLWFQRRFLIRVNDKDVN